MRKKESVDFEIRGVFPSCFEKYTPEKHLLYVIKNDLTSAIIYNMVGFYLPYISLPYFWDDCQICAIKRCQNQFFHLTFHGKQLTCKTSYFRLAILNCTIAPACFIGRCTSSHIHTPLNPKAVDKIKHFCFFAVSLFLATVRNGLRWALHTCIETKPAGILAKYGRNLRNPGWGTYLR